MDFGSKLQRSWPSVIQLCCLWACGKKDASWQKSLTKKSRSPHDSQEAQRDRRRPGTRLTHQRMPRDDSVQTYKRVCILMKSAPQLPSHHQRRTKTSTHESFVGETLDVQTTTNDTKQSLVSQEENKPTRMGKILPKYMDK